MSTSPRDPQATDEQLMDAYIDGDDEAFRLLFERYASACSACPRNARSLGR